MHIYTPIGDFRNVFKMYAYLTDISQLCEHAGLLKNYKEMGNRIDANQIFTFICYRFAFKIRKLPNHNVKMINGLEKGSHVFYMHMHTHDLFVLFILYH